MLYIQAGTLGSVCRCKAWLYFQGKKSINASEGAAPYLSFP